MRHQSEITHLVIHHSASPLSVKAEHIKKWHLDKGWEDIGYHYILECDPVRLVYGRRPWQVGAHCPPNTGRLGFCIVGDNTKESSIWTEEQVVSGRLFIESVRLVYPGIEVVAHKSLRKTLCPGREIGSLLL